MSDRVSGLLSVYNGEAYIAEAIDSMLAELGADDEIIVVDDGSTDRTATILDSYRGRITVLTQPNAGTAAALNRAVREARGGYLAFNDADDLWEPGRIARQRAVLDADTATDIVSGMSFQFVSPELSDELKQRFAPPVELMRGATFPCLILRRSVYDSVGPFDESQRATFAYSWLSRAKELGHATEMLPDIVSRRRLHPSNWSRLNRDQLNAESLRAMREHILRRRGKSE